MAQRATLRRRLAYNTNSNRRVLRKTPGGKLVYHYIKKQASPMKCSDCKDPLKGVVKVRPHKLHSISKRQKTVNRAYGGSCCSTCVRERILKAYLVEERKIVNQAVKKV